VSEQLESRLREHLATIDRAVIDGHPVVAARVERAGHRKRRKRSVAIAMMAVAVVGGSAAVVSRRTQHETILVGSSPSAASTVPSTTTIVTAAPATTTTTTTPSAPNWVAIAPDPRPGITGSSVVWTGTEALVLGGLDASGKAERRSAAYNPATETWRNLADSPAPDALIGRVAVWTGNKALVVGGTSEDGTEQLLTGSLLDPATDTWQTIAAAPYYVSAKPPTAWTGKELLIWPSGPAVNVKGFATIAYNPSTDAWRQVASPPIAGRQQAASVWTGTEWLVWGGTTGTNELNDGAAYNPTTDSWRVMAPSPLSARGVGGVWTGSELLIASGWTAGNPRGGNGMLVLDDGAAYNPTTDSWRRIASGHAHPGFEPVWTGRHMILFVKGRYAFTYDFAGDHWQETYIENDFTGQAVVAGASVLLLGDRNPSAFTPPP
jgi:hypothetical protein